MTTQATTERGFSLIEVLLALTIVTLTATALVYLTLDSMTSIRASYERVQATYLAQEGIEVIKMFADEDMDQVTTGVHGLAFTGGVWSLSSSSDTTDGYTRQVTITDVATDTKQVVSNVTWPITPARTGNVSFTRGLTDWNNTEGDAGDIVVDTSGGTGSSSISGIQLDNTHASDRTLSALRLYWAALETLYEVAIDGSTVFSTATTSGSVSGETTAITDHTIPGGVTHEITSLQFTGDVSGSDMTMTLFFDDGSTHHAYIEL